MFIYIQDIEVEVDFNMDVIMNILDDVHDSTVPIFVKFISDLKREDGHKARGGYGQGLLPTRKGPAQVHIIYINADCDMIETATVLIHEYAHVLSQQNHDFLMYELWKEYLREEFKRRWDNAIGKENWEDDRGRTFVVGEVCSDRAD